MVRPFDADRLRRAVGRSLSVAPERNGNDDDAAAEPQRHREAVAGAPSRDGSSPVTPDLVRIPVQKDGRTVLANGDAIVYAAASRGYSSL